MDNQMSRNPYGTTVLPPSCVSHSCLSTALDYPVCVKASGKNTAILQRLWLQYHLSLNLAQNLAAEHQNIAEDVSVAVLPSLPYDPCENDYMTSYLNRVDVKEALHVPTDHGWGKCSGALHYDYNDLLHDMAPIYNYLIDSGVHLKILVFSGDDDTVCATLGTQEWIWDLGYNVSGKPWQPYYVSGQPAGYLTKWKGTGLAFMTVHGAGHEVR